jgi:hypothetical protein
LTLKHFRTDSKATLEGSSKGISAGITQRFSNSTYAPAPLSQASARFVQSQYLDIFRRRLTKRQFELSGKVPGAELNPGCHNSDGQILPQIAKYLGS